jgi:hypothetical protein
LGAGFPVIFPDTGPLKQAKAPKKKKPKKPKVKRPKKPKRVKLKLPARDIPTIGEADRQGNTPKRDGSLPALLPLETSTKSVDTAAQRLRETITEEDELLLLIC